jgi:MoxR-like ATPase
MRIGFGYPDRDEELDAAPADGPAAEATELDPVLDADAAAGTADGRAGRGRGHCRRYCVDLAAATRTRPQVLVGASPRGALALLLVARALAVLRRRDYVTPEDVKAVALAVLAHRVTLKPEMWLRRVSPQDVVREVLG